MNCAYNCGLPVVKIYVLIAICGADSTSPNVPANLSCNLKVTLGMMVRYKIYEYTISNTNKVTGVTSEIGPDNHFKLFSASKGKDTRGTYAEYRGERNAILMYLRQFRSDFSGLVGKHSTERAVTAYNEREDETKEVIVLDDDYPHAAFVCLPRLKVIVVADSQALPANSAIERLSRILAHRKSVLFVAAPLREPYDLRVAIQKFNVFEVSFEIYPVNPHTEDLGKKLDESRKLDHIKKLAGKATATPSSPLALEGGLLTAIQQLQKSGHCKVGFRGTTDEGIEINVPKPRDRMELSDDDKDRRDSELSDLNIEFKREKITYPFNDKHFTQIRGIVKKLQSNKLEQE